MISMLARNFPLDMNCNSTSFILLATATLDKFEVRLGIINIKHAMVTLMAKNIFVALEWWGEILDWYF